MLFCFVLFDVVRLFDLGRLCWFGLVWPGCVGLFGLVVLFWFGVVVLFWFGVVRLIWFDAVRLFYFGWVVLFCFV